VTFRNDAINRVNVHYGIQQLAQGAGGGFILAYLLRAGVSVPLTLCTMAGIVGGRFLIRPVVLPLAQRFGIRTTLIVGTLLEALAFPILPHVHGADRALVAEIVVAAIGGVCYWTSYHAYFAALGDPEWRGGQIGAREAISAVVGIVAPLLGGFTLVTVGPTAAFTCAAIVQALAALPLLAAPQVAVRAEAPGGYRAAWTGAALMFTDGWLAGGYFYVWQVALFVTLGESYTAYGGAMALAGVVGAGLSLGTGRLVDLGHARRSVIVAYAIAAAVVALKAVAFGTPWLATLATALGPIVVATLVPVFMAKLYNLAKSSPCPMRFHIAAEAGWDVGCGGACLAAAGLVWAGHSLSLGILLALAGAAGGFLILTRSYAPRARGAEAS
jgi:MFS transporter, DHA1 family, inner membrane transport protein